MRFFIRIKTLCLVIFAYTYISATEIRLAYSDLFPADFQKYLYQIASEIEEDLNLDFTNFSAIESGSLPILEDFLSNRLDICIIALPENNDFPILPEDSVVKIPFCYKSSVVVVNAENPASEITINQLGMMFSTSSPSSNLLTWRDFGISSFSTSKIKAYAIKEANGISSDLFRYSVLREKQFNSSVNFEIEENLQRMILQDKAAVGIFPHSPSNPKLKALFVAQDDQSIPYGPSIDNIYYSVIILFDCHFILF